MFGILGGLFVALVRQVQRSLRWIFAFIFGPAGSTPRINMVSPPSGWPGTIVTISGTGFAEGLDGNRVRIGNVDALVMEGAPTRLLVLVGEGATNGPITVNIGSQTLTASEPFTLRPWPDPRDSMQSGAPMFFHGPQRGTPTLGTGELPVFVILAFPKGAPPADRTAARNTEVFSYIAANQFWAQGSYSKTSFGLRYTADWVELPHPRSYYVWEAFDRAWAQRDLVTATKRSTVVLGNRAVATHQGMRLAIIDVTNSAAPAELSPPSGVTPPPGVGYPLHIVAQGNTAFVAGGTNGLIVLNVSGNSPIPITSVALGGRLVGLDIAGNVLAAAAMEGGIELYDITNPSAPIRRSVVPADGLEWVTCVKIAGNRLYVGAGAKLRRFDISNTAAPFELDGGTSTTHWAMALDVSGNTLVVATDGSGLVTFDVTGAPAERSKQLGVLRLHDVKLAGTTAFCAGADAGFHIVNVATPAVPAVVKTAPTPRACYSVTLAGNRAHLGLGGKFFAIADITNPAAPAIGAEISLNGVFLFGADPDIAGLRTNLTIAADSDGKNKGDAIWVHGLQAAKAADPSLDFNDFEGVVVIIFGEGAARAASGLKNQVSHEDQTVAFAEKKGVIWLGSGSTWGRKAHELGHWFGMVDIYSEKFDNGTAIASDAEAWDMAGDHDQGPLFSGREIDRMKYFDPANIVRKNWDPAAGESTERFKISAHGGFEDTGDAIHLLQLIVAKDFSYYVEVREKAAGHPFDQQIPLPPGANGRVLVTRVSEVSTISNIFEQPTMLFGPPLDVGGSVVDAGRLLRIEVESKVSDNPLTYMVAVHWNEIPPPDENGKFDLTINPWSEETWETEDIWINSVLNDPKPGDEEFEFNEGGDPKKPRLSGDRPWIKRKNTIYARIRNTGPLEDVHDVWVTAYISSPPGIGDNGSWVTLASQQIANVPNKGEQIVKFDWQPEADKHTCITIAIAPKPGERQPRNNKAQENVALFDSRGASSHEPVVLEAEVRSPFSVWRKVDLRVQGLPLGWHAVVEHGWMWLGPKGAKPTRAVIWTDLHSPRSDERGIPSEAFARVEGWTDFGQNYIPIGGILAGVRANKRVRLNVEMGVNGNELRVIGCLSAAVLGVPIVVEIVTDTGTSQLAPTKTDASGCFDIRQSLPRGRYAVQVFSSSTAQVAAAESSQQILMVT